MSTQSGALGLAILDYARRLDIGISSFVSVGNKADVSGNDLIQYWADDPAHVGHPALPRELRQSEEVQRDRAACRADQADRRGQGRALDGGVARRRLAYRRARLERRRGRRAVPAGGRHPDRAARRAVRRRGAALAPAGAAQGARVAILTNAGGPGILAADACEANGLQLPALSEATRAELRAFLPAAASVGNPVDMLASAPADHYRRALAAILRDDGVDSVIAIFIPPLVTDPTAVAGGDRRAVREGTHGKPVLGRVHARRRRAGRAGADPVVRLPGIGRAGARARDAYGQWRAKPVIPAPRPRQLRSRRPSAGSSTAILAGAAAGRRRTKRSALLTAAGIESAASRGRDGRRGRGRAPRPTSAIPSR